MKLNFLQTGLIYHAALVMLLSMISFFIFIGFFSWFGIFFNTNLILIFLVLIFFVMYIENIKKIIL